MWCKLVVKLIQLLHYKPNQLKRTQVQDMAIHFYTLFHIPYIIIVEKIALNYFPLLDCRLVFLFRFLSVLYGNCHGWDPGNWHHSSPGCLHHNNQVSAQTFLLLLCFFFCIVFTILAF